MTYGQTGSGKTFTMTGDSGNYQVTKKVWSLYSAAVAFQLHRPVTVRSK